MLPLVPLPLGLNLYVIVPVVSVPPSVEQLILTPSGRPLQPISCSQSPPAAPQASAAALLEASPPSIIYCSESRLTHNRYSLALAIPSCLVRLNSEVISLAASRILAP